MLKQEYNRMNEKILPDPGLNDAVLERAVPRRTHRLRPAVAIALVLALALTAVPVMAANGGEILYWIRNTLLTQVQESSTVNGICVEVVGLTAEDSKAEVLLRFEKEDGTPLGVPKLGNIYFDAYHTWNLTGCRSYLTDEEELMLLELSCRSGSIEEFIGNQINLIIDAISLTRTTPCEVPLELTDSQTITVPGDFLENQEVHNIFRSFGVGSSDGHEEFFDRNTYTIIAPGEAVIDVTEQVGVTGVCYIDGELHVQICQRVPYEAGTFYAWLEDAEGNRVFDYAHHNFEMDRDGQYIVGKEHYFDVSPEELTDYKLMVEITDTVEGPWKVSFELNESNYAE